MVGGGPFDLPPRAWTDDTSMAACLAQSLVDRGGFDPDDQMRAYLASYRTGYRSPTGVCFDIGSATARALERFAREREPYAGDSDPLSAGNGSLMRLAPAPIVSRTIPSGPSGSPSSVLAPRTRPSQGSSRALSTARRSSRPRGGGGSYSAKHLRAWRTRWWH